jgi:hypothetical protein
MTSVREPLTPEAERLLNIFKDPRWCCGESPLDQYLFVLDEMKLPQNEDLCVNRRSLLKELREKGYFDEESPLAPTAPDAIKRIKIFVGSVWPEDADEILYPGEFYGFLDEAFNELHLRNRANTTS